MTSIFLDGCEMTTDIAAVPLGDGRWKAHIRVCVWTPSDLLEGSLNAMEEDFLAFREHLEQLREAVMEDRRSSLLENAKIMRARARGAMN